MSTLIRQLACWLTTGHRFVNSRRQPGYITCERCKRRKRFR